MKKLAITLAVLTSMTTYQAKAIETVAVTNIVTYAGLSLGFATVVGLTSSGDACEIMSCKGEAEKILEDSQEYFVTGELTDFMAQKVGSLKQTQDLSDDEAVDFLMTNAEEYLNN
jgi:hypothetical protein